MAERLRAIKRKAVILDSHQTGKVHCVKLVGRLQSDPDPLPALRENANRAFIP